VLRTTPGPTTGIDLDRLALVSPGYSDAPTNDDVSAPPTVVRADPDSAVVKGSGTPYWVRLDQSANRGWEATARTRGTTTDLGAAHPLDGFASGWAMTDRTSARTAFAFSWQPQRTVDRALAISAVAVLACLVLCVVRPRRRRRADHAVPVPASDPFGLRAPRVAVSALAVVVGAAFGGLIVGAALALLAVGAAIAPRVRPLAIAVRLAPLLAMGAAVEFVWARQARNDYPHLVVWPTDFRAAHLLAFFAIVGLALLVAGDRAEDLATGPDERPPDAAPDEA
jgi:hypothetical protein